MDIIDKLFELVKDNNSPSIFEQNIDLFQEFYYNFMHVDYYGEKVITIYKYLLAINIPEDHEIMPFINSKIIEDLNIHEQKITQSVYSKDFEVNDIYCDNLFGLIKLIEEFRSLQVKGSLNRLIDKDRFVRDYTGAMMVALNSGFFDLSNEKILVMLNAIKNNEYLKSVIENGMKTDLLDKDYLFQYFKRYLFNAEFVDDENLKDDQLAIALRESKIKDYDLLKKTVFNLSNGMLTTFLDGDLSLALNVIENSTNDEFKRKELFNLVLNKFIESDRSSIMTFLIYDSRKENYIDKQKEIELLDTFIKSYPNGISEEEVNYIISSKESIPPKTYNLFKINLRAEIESEAIDEKYNSEAIPESNFNFWMALWYIDDILKNNKKVEEPLIMVYAIRSIVSDITDGKVTVLFDYNPKQHGCAYTEGGNTISLNYELIESFCETTNREENPESLKLFETMFHELRHIDQFDQINSDKMDKELYTMYKEDVIRAISSNYYDVNYFGISFERDARIKGANSTAEFLQTHFSYMEKAISYFKDRAIKEENKEVEDKKEIFELSKNYTVDEILSKLISINPSVLNRFDLLNKGFNKDGSKKNTGIGY